MTTSRVPEQRSREQHQAIALKEQRFSFSVQPVRLRGRRAVHARRRSIYQTAVS